MLFNSFDFAVFLPLVYLLYWFLFQKHLKLRNFFLLTASYVFYGFWDWRFLSLILISSLMDYILAMQIHATQPEQKNKRKVLLVLSLVLNLGFLGFFKYYNFFVESFIATFTLFGKEFSYSPMHIILPVGISFYTFQSLSYTLDVYFKKMEPTRNLINFLAFVSFFPQLVAGPIERAKNLLPQFDEVKHFDYQAARSGLLFILFGLFKKIMIADRLAVFINQTYGNIEEAKGIAMLTGVFFFAFQLYLDFSAYSDIAIGTARLFGFKLSTNFRRPYLSTSFSGFWKRWHITLSSWFQDYIYIPLGGNRKGVNRKIVNLLVVFFLSGLWHGASWNFVIWGLINGLFLILLDPLFKLEKPSGGMKRFFSAILVFSGWTLSLIFFRAQTFGDAMLVFQNIGFGGVQSLYEFGLNSREFTFALWLVVGMMIYEVIAERWSETLQEKFYSGHYLLRWGVYLLLTLSIIYLGAYGAGNDNSFIYFQF
ncbi:Peptidoglycan O-acetyltransferase [bioreactor metagenome]|jgi:D-alanyl-lipoteichoic acid acyltransferase DltB (MBOAT superfamily)|uniref:Peptidoglycan O-acetyltransferase n=1 Tax=bioreactor metagenome TaxID=1076179 RepID=A0A644WF47_9ZZZZ|nr:MBOAT family O-acyltransferase [Paludibacter sp.]